MRDLTEIRQQIDQIDQKMLALFIKSRKSTVPPRNICRKDYVLLIRNVKGSRTYYFIKKKSHPEKIHLPDGSR